MGRKQKLSLRLFWHTRQTDQAASKVLPRRKPQREKPPVELSRSTLYRWQKSGLISGRKVGGILFYSVAEVKTIIDNVGGNLEGKSKPS